MDGLLELKEVKSCAGNYILAVYDTLDVVSGKWKLPIIGVLLFGKKRFRELGREIPKITPRMLSKELRNLEVNGIVTRTVHDTVPVSVEYELTQSGQTLTKVLDVMVEWGLEHRNRIIGRKK